MQVQCRELFQNRCQYALQVLEKLFEARYNFDFEHIKNNVSNALVFSASNHIGGLVPLYYTSGVPTNVWRCVRCHEFIADAGADEAEAEN